MKKIHAGYEILTPIDANDIYKKLEIVGRTCYKSEDKITEESAEKFVRALVKRGHEAMLEHASISVRFIVDRGVSHELVRHRIASFAQESTRYCNYTQDKFGNELTFVRPAWHPDFPSFVVWHNAMQVAEEAYFKMIALGCTPEEARSVLPNSLKTEVVMTANLREWRHFFKLRAVGVTGKPHPQMAEVAVPLLKEFAEKLPAVFGDILEELKD